MERRFRCTACGKCCFGQIPLTLGEMLDHSGRFPLAMVWRAVPKGTRAYALTERLGTPTRIQKTRTVAVSIVPTAYLPPSMACPELTPEGQCGIHDGKPLRCRTMPFYPFRDASDQAELLRPRQGWLCDIGETAPVVYRDGTIVDSHDFDVERKALLAQSDAMRTYFDYVVRYMPWVLDNLPATIGNQEGGVVTSLSSFLTACKPVDTKAIAARQQLVMERFAAKTADIEGLEAYHRNFAGWAKEMAYLAS
ncbi:MAG TPA: YkgJ family cysteine cluster protein [Rhodocyclaceae bacterium]|nr:YkgJ family cysteine cluster protein [Rhodocyclaceae bacterium]